MPGMEKTHFLGYSHMSCEFKGAFQQGREAKTVVYVSRKKQKHMDVPHMCVALNLL